MLRYRIFDVFDLWDLNLANTTLKQGFAGYNVHLEKIADCHKNLQLFLPAWGLELLPSFRKSFWHRHTHGYLNEFESVFVSAANFLGQLYAFLQVKVDLILLWLCPEAKPSRHSIVLELLILNLLFVELEHSFKFVHEYFCAP
jgi:hypothetical protein